MPRSARIVYPDLIYHVMNRGNNRQKIFRDSKDYQKYLELVKEYSSQFAITIYAYALMDTHLHLLVEAPRNNLSLFMKSLNIRYCWYFKKRYSQQLGHLFQGRFKSIIVDKDNYLLELTRYIHLNPVKAGLVKRPADYEWSSYRNYLKGDDNLVNIGTVLEHFGNSSADTEQYRAFIEDGLVGVKELKGPPVYSGLIYGAKDFGKKILGKCERRKRAPNTNRVRRGEDRLKVKTLQFTELVHKVSRYYNISANVLLNGRDRTATQLRHYLIYLLRRYTNFSLAEIGERVGLVHYTSIAKAINRLAKKINDNQQLSSELSVLENYVHQKENS